MSTDISTDIKKNYRAVRNSIDEACKKIGRDPSEVLLIAVSKTSLNELCYTNLCPTFLICQLLEGRKINSKVLLVIYILESELRNSTL